MKRKIDLAAPIRHFVGITFFLVITVTCIQVICRYVFNNSLVWSEELVRFMVVWMCLVGSAVSNYDDDHMTINIIMEKLPRPVQFVMFHPSADCRGVLRSVLLFQYAPAEGSGQYPAGRDPGPRLCLAAGRYSGPGHHGGDDHPALV